MQSSLYVALSAQRSLQQRLETAANNVANVNTAGFRAEEIRFQSALSNAGKQPVAFASIGSTFISRHSGQVTKTDNALDVAVEGDAWLAVRSPEGTIYTRDGRFQIAPNGQLQTVTGYPVLDAGGAEILLDPAGGPPTIGRDGTISQTNGQAGALGLFAIDERARLSRVGTSGVATDLPANPVVDVSRAGVRQGFVEGSNVNPVAEIAALMEIQRQFEAASTSISELESSFQDAIRSLGASS